MKPNTPPSVQVYNENEMAIPYYKCTYANTEHYRICDGRVAAQRGLSETPDCDQVTAEHSLSGHSGRGGGEGKWGQVGEVEVPVCSANRSYIPCPWKTPSLHW